MSEQAVRAHARQTQAELDVHMLASCSPASVVLAGVNAQRSPFRHRRMLLPALRRKSTAE